MEFVRLLLRKMIEPSLTVVAPNRTWDNDTKFLTMPTEAKEVDTPTDVCSLPFFCDVIADMQAIEGGRKGCAGNKDYTSSKMCFRLDSKCSVKTIQQANDRKYTTADDEKVIGISKASAAIFAKASKLAPMDLPSNNDSFKTDGSASLTSPHSSEDSSEDSRSTGS
jgi:hypothetical protein